LKLHLDGARIFNALAACDYSAGEIGSSCDTVSICFSKGMGAPVGSILVGSKETIKKARRIRKVFGGGMRQAGILAAACIFALDHHLDRIEEDHEHARQLAKIFQTRAWVNRVHPVETNIVLFDVEERVPVSQVIRDLAAQNIKMMAFGPHTIRAITHLDVSAEHIHLVEEITNSLIY
jgi:threonine aldolase